MGKLSFTKGKEIANIYKLNKSNDSETLVTKLKIESSFYDTDEDIKKTSTSRKESDLVINNNFFQLPAGYTMRLSPTVDKNQNFRMVVAAASGSGKSIFVSNFIIDYRKRYPKKSVFLFSSHDADQSIDRANPIRIQITEAEVANSIKTQQPLFENKNLANSLVVFDDAYSGQKKLLVNFWESLAADLAQNGRKLGIDIVCVIHNTNYSRTRLIMSEATHYVLFLKSGAKAMSKRILKDYLSIEDKKALKILFKLPTRYAIFSNLAPMYILTENQCFEQEYIDPE